MQTPSDGVEPSLQAWQADAGRAKWVRSLKEEVDVQTSIVASARVNAAHTANYEDASIWRWFSDAYEAKRLRWCRADGRWLVSVDHKHVATEATFDAAIRAACSAHRRLQPYSSD